MKVRANKLNGKEWLKNSFSIWKDISKTPEEKKKNHPAIFPISLVEKILDCYMPDIARIPIVLDCFAGSGSTLTASMNKSYKALGIDTNKDYKTLFIQQQGENDNIKYNIGDARDIKSYKGFDAFDICITSPPYWDILNMKRTVDKKEISSYSNDDIDIGNIKDYDIFLQSLELVFKNVHTVLKDSRHLIVNVSDLRKKSIFYPLHMDTVNIGIKSGFILSDIIIWDRQKEYNFMRPLGYPYKYVINKVHEYILVFRKE